MDTDPAADMCHICFPFSCEGENRSTKSEDVEGMDAISKPGGGLYVIGASVTEGDFWVLSRVSHSYLGTNGDEQYAYFCCLGA